MKFIERVTYMFRINLVDSRGIINSFSYYKYCVIDEVLGVINK